MSHEQGVLEVICGPMFSGKSEELIRRLRRVHIAQRNVIAFKPSIDNRYNVEHIASHNGNIFQAQSVDAAHSIHEIVHRDAIDVIGIDEVQFFDKEIISIICKLIDQKKRVIVAGLDRDFRGIPFGSMPTLLAIADSITKLQAICYICHNDAILTQRLLNNKPAQFNDPIIMIGKQESYQARCRNCFSIDQLPQLV